jgi:hypothetical protein
MSRKSVFISFLAIASGCLSQTDFPTDRKGLEVIISGKISSLDEQTLVSVARTSLTARLPIPVISAQVILIDENAMEVEFRHIGGGIYKPQGFSPLPGKTYRVQVQIDGEFYSSTEQVMPLSPPLGKAYFSYRNEEIVDDDGTILSLPIVDIFCDFEIPIERPFIKLSTDEVYVIRPTDFPDFFNSIPPDCFVSQRVDAQSIYLIDPRSSNKKDFTQVLAGKREVDESFLLRHYFIVTLESTSYETYEYWRKARALVSQVGSIFDTPPAQLRGNVKSMDDPSRIVWGNIEVVNASQTRFYILPSDLPIFIPDKCPYIPGKELFEYPDKCLNCLSVKGSTNVPPPWF